MPVFYLFRKYGDVGVFIDKQCLYAEDRFACLANTGMKSPENPNSPRAS